ncbi:MAG: transcriptional repressor NrdR [Nitrospirae bacterium]|nr:transcriptional repressor NrdR [Nitrospirota bacterium]
MKCPFCGHLEDKVVDSREAKEGDAIRRRRECLRCRRRFTTYEHIEDVLPVVVKKDGRREPFDRNKILGGLKKACEKRPVAMDVLEEIVSRIEKRAQESGEKEIPSSMIGGEVMRELQILDEVAYVRFASVYREFKGINEFMDELKDLLKERNKK